jgi:hypothetical protein
MRSLVYVSSAVELFTDNELKALLQKSRINNQTANITGMLLYKDGNFMQYLEGPGEAVDAVMTRVKADPRHTGLLVLLQEEQAKRQFADWSMGFKKLKKNEDVVIPGHNDFLNLPLTDERFQQNPTRTMQLLLRFKKIVGSV